MVSIPVLLAVEFENFDGYSDDGPPWDFPDTLLPNDRDTEGIKLGLIYDLVGVVFFRNSDSHFFAQYTPKPQADIHEYDGLLRNGSPIIKLGTKFQEVNSDYSLDAPPGSTVSAVFYHLRGGWKSQQRFYASRSIQCDTLYSLSFSSSTLDVLPSMTYNDPSLEATPGNELTWMNNPWNPSTIEYTKKRKVVREWEDISDDNNSALGELAPGAESEDSVARLVLSNKRDPSVIAVSELESLWNMNCRCGISRDGNKLYDADIYGLAIQCKECYDWLHIACQQDARAGKLAKKAAFKCDRCDLIYLIIRKPNAKKQTKAQLKRYVTMHITS